MAGQLARHISVDPVLQLNNVRRDEPKPELLSPNGTESIEFATLRCQYPALKARNFAMPGYLGIGVSLRVSSRIHQAGVAEY